MRFSIVLIIAVTSLAGCGRTQESSTSDGSARPDGAIAPDADAGPRLVPWQVQSEGSPPLVVGTYDTQEKVHCRFLRDEAGELRCLPWGVAPLTETNMFWDPTCQQRVYQWDWTRGKVFPHRPVAVPLPQLQCEPRRYAVGTLRVPPEGATLYAGTPCAPVDPLAAPPTNGLDVAVDETLPAERWATGTELDGPLIGGRLRVRQVATAEGARFGDHLVDEEFGRTCELRTFGSNLDAGQPGCWPDLLIQQAGYEGADCMGTVAVWSNETCADPLGISMGGRWFALGAMWTGPVSFRGHGCDLLSDGSPNEPYVFHELGAPLATMTTANGEWKVEGSGRLQLRGLRGPAGETVPLDNTIAGPNGWIVARYFDTSTGLDCDPRWTPEGLVRCVPTNVIVGPWNGGLGAVFSDAACQEPVLACPGFANTPCGGASVISTAIDDNGELRDVSLNVAVDLTTVYSTSADGSCSPQPATAFAPYTFFTLGGALPWDMYPALDEINGRASGAP